MSTDTSTTTDLELRAPSGPPSIRDLPGGVPAALQEAYPAFDPHMDLSEALEMALGPGVEVRLGDLTRLKVPADGINGFMVPDPDTGKDRLVDELIGIPVGMASRRSYWVSSEVTGAAPDCSSRDLRVGLGMYGPGSEANPTGECAKCPMAAIGSANKGTAASACKEQRLLFLLTGDELLPYMMIVPPGSLQNHKQFGMTLFKRRVRGADRGVNETGKPMHGSSWSAVEIRVSLEKDQNKVGQKYNKLAFTVNRRLDPDELAVVDLYARYVETLIEEQADTLDVVTADEAANPGGTADTAGYDEEGFPEDDVPAPSTKGTKGR